MKFFAGLARHGGHGLPRIVVSCLCAAWLAAFVKADTLTWIGGTSGDFTSPANWSSSGSHTSPMPGDIVKFTSAGVTVTAESAFDISGGGLTIDCDFFQSSDMNSDREKGVMFGVELTGSGCLTKTGRGQMMPKVAFNHTGGTRVENGYMCARKNFSGDYPFGTGKITIDRSSGNNPQVFLFSGGLQITNDMEIVGASSSSPPPPSFAASNDSGTFMGKVVASSDITFAGGHCNSYSGAIKYFTDFTCDVDNPGNTLFWGSCVSWGTFIKYRGNINCSMNVGGYGTATVKCFDFSGTGTVADVTLRLNAMTNTFSAAAVWAGTNITVAANRLLVLNGVGNLSPQTELTLETGAAVVLNSNFYVHLKKFYVDGTEMPKGSYNASNLPGRISGKGRIIVNDKISFWTGGAVGDWNEASNWSPAGVPGPGSLVVFTEAGVTVSNDVPVDISGTDLEIECDFTTAKNMNYDYAEGLLFAVQIAGSGRVIKSGPGQMLIKKSFVHTGGTLLTDGYVCCRKADSGEYPVGSGKVTIDRSGGTDPMLFIYAAGTLLTNDVEIVGDSASSDIPPSLAASNDAGTFMGKVVASSDITFSAGHCNTGTPRRRIYFECDVDNPGHTLFWTSYVVWGTSIDFSGSVNCSMDIFAATTSGSYNSRVNFFNFNGIGTATDVNLRLGAETNIFSAAASWAGTNVVVAAGKTLELYSRGNLSEFATLRFEAGSKLFIPSGERVCVKNCFTNGVAIASGSYSEANLPEFRIGSGILRVGVKGLAIFVK